MNSCLYECVVMHHRLAPKENKFRYNVFMFYFDLDEIDTLSKTHWLFSRNTFNWFNFRDSDHLQGTSKGRSGNTVKNNIIDYLKRENVVPNIGKIMLLTNVATLGYSFNPISFYLCFDENQKPVCAVAEVCNTHHEMKLYLLDKECLTNDTFRRLVTKYFYVSPFADLDSSFDFIFNIPTEVMHMRVDDYQEGKRFLLTSLTGKKKKFSDANLLWYGLKFPFITLKIIFLIYWQAVILYMKRVPFHKKNFNLHLQHNLYQTKKM